MNFILIITGNTSKHLNGSYSDSPDPSFVVGRSGYVITYGLSFPQFFSVFFVKPVDTTSTDETSDTTDDLCILSTSQSSISSGRATPIPKIEKRNVTKIDVSSLF